MNECTKSSMTEGKDPLLSSNLEPRTNLVACLKHVCFFYFSSTRMGQKSKNIATNHEINHFMALLGTVFTGPKNTSWSAKSTFG